MNTESILPVPITVTPIFNSKELMSILMKLLEVDSYQELFSWISNLVPWTLSEPDHSVNFSDQITSYSDKLELVITGPKVIIPKELNSLIQSSMS